MNKSVEDLVEKVREYAEDPVPESKPRRPLTGYYADPESTESSTRMLPLNVPLNGRGLVEGRNNSLPRMKKTRGNSEVKAEKSRSMEDLSSGSSSREVLDEVQQS